MTCIKSSIGAQSLSFAHQATRVELRNLSIKGLYLVVWALFIVMVVGCAAPPDPAPKPALEPSPESEETQSHRPDSALPSGPVTPNPYTTDAPALSEEARNRFAVALASMERQEWEKARQELVAMTGDFPQLSGPWVNLALVHREQERVDEAETALRQALAVNPRNLTAYNQLALLKREAGDFEAAERWYQQALEVWPFHAQTHRNLGILYDLYRGEHQRALRHYRAFQQRQEQPDREVMGWIMDLERRIDRANDSAEASS